MNGRKHSIDAGNYRREFRGNSSMRTKVWWKRHMNKLDRRHSEREIRKEQGDADLAMS